MAYTGINLYAGATASTVAKLPSPTDVKPSHEIIWSEDTGRAQSGVNKAKMIGSVVDEKMSYEIKWGILSATEFNTIKTELTPGFFYFAIDTTLGGAQSNAKTFYRSEIAYELLPVGSTTYYKNVSCSVIQQ